MGRVVGGVLAMLFLGLALTGPAAAKQVYLKDGGIIDCQSFREADGKVVVQVNRDVVVDLSRNEVDMKRTFPAKAVKKAKKHVKAKRRALAQPVAKPAKAGTPPAAPGQPVPAAKPASPAAKPGAPGGKPAVPKPAGAAPAGTPAAKTPVAAASVKPPAPAASTPAAKPAPGIPAQPAGVKPADRPAPAAGTPKPAAPPNATPVPKPVQRAPIPLKPAEPAPMPAAAALGAMMGTSVLVPLLLLVLICIVSFWKVFEKAGEAGWKCLVPVYNLFVLVKISGKPWWWFLLLFVPVVNLIFSILMHLALAGRFGKSQLFGVGLCFFGFIFFPILAFDKSTYS